jgi:predicted PurR-regulated permease PerM
MSYPGVFQETYSAGAFIGLLVGTIYCGIFVMLNNHYVFKPKVQRLVKRLSGRVRSRSAEAVGEMFIDVVTSLSICTFCMGSVFLSGSTNCIEVYLVSDGIWMGVYASVVLYRCRNQQGTIEWKYAIKNSFALMLCYATLVVHFAIDYYYVTFGVVLLVVYLINQVTNIYFDRIEDYISKQFLRSE